jgi:flagellar hook-basal body complex protein FliE
MMKAFFNGVDNGSIVTLRATHPLHFTEKIERKRQDDDVSTSFAELLKGSINKVNNLQIESERLTQKMIYEPESVDIHTVMIAAQKADVALSFTKAVRDEVIRAFRELVNLR